MEHTVEHTTGGQRRFLLGFLAGAVLLAVLGILLLTVGIGYLVLWDGQWMSLGRKIALVKVEGVIEDPHPIVEQIAGYAADGSVLGIVLRVDSPGGTAAAAQEIYQEILKFQLEGKTVVASLGSVAASGGYYVSCPADVIFANPGTLTGSIGVVFSVANMEELFRKVGVRFEVVKSGDFKDIGSASRSMTEEERELLQELLDDVYDQFVTAVATQRNLQKDTVEEFADGKIFSGRQARELMLVDELGGLRDAIALAGELCGLGPNPTVVQKRERGNWLRDLIRDTIETFSEVSSGPAARFQYIAG